MVVMSLHFLPSDSKLTYSSAISGRQTRPKPIHFSILAGLLEASLYQLQTPVAVTIETLPGAVGTALETISREFTQESSEF